MRRLLPSKQIVSKKKLKSAKTKKQSKQQNADNEIDVANIPF